MSTIRCRRGQVQYFSQPELRTNYLHKVFKDIINSKEELQVTSI